jgi:hypothetical protein
MLAFTDLEVWKKARILRNNIQALVKSFPADERYRLSDRQGQSAIILPKGMADIIILTLPGF